MKRKSATGGKKRSTGPISTSNEITILFGAGAQIPKAEPRVARSRKGEKEKATASTASNQRWHCDLAKEKGREANWENPTLTPTSRMAFGGQNESCGAQEEIACGAAELKKPNNSGAKSSEKVEVRPLHVMSRRSRFLEGKGVILG